MPDDNAARGRFITIQVVRLSGIAMAIVGALILRDRIDVDHVVGHVLLVAGFLEVLVVPRLLARKWRTPPA